MKYYGAEVRAKSRKDATDQLKLPYGALSKPLPRSPQPVPVFSDEDHVSVPRGLIAAACSAIDKKREAESVLSELRRYTLGDLSRQTAPDAEALVEELVEALEELVDLMDDIRQGEYTPDSFTTQPARVALAAYRKRDSKPCPAIQEGYAGATVWIGDKRVTQVVTEGSLKYESEPGKAITHAAQACLDLLAAAHRKGSES